jgi:hypothetical protein
MGARDSIHGVFTSVHIRLAGSQRMYSWKLEIVQREILYRNNWKLEYKVSTA